MEDFMWFRFLPIFYVSFQIPIGISRGTLSSRRPRGRGNRKRLKPEFYFVFVTFRRSKDLLRGGSQDRVDLRAKARGEVLFHKCLAKRLLAMPTLLLTSL